VFHVHPVTISTAAMEGMDHISATLEKASGISTSAAAQAWARAHGIQLGNKPDAVARIQRLAASERKNSDLVHHSVPTNKRAVYF
jgi:hypothetical protein